MIRGSFVVFILFFSFFNATFVYELFNLPL